MTFIWQCTTKHLNLIQLKRNERRNFFLKIILSQMHTDRSKAILISSPFFLDVCLQLKGNTLTLTCHFLVHFSLVKRPTLRYCDNRWHCTKRKQSKRNPEKILTVCFSNKNLSNQFKDMVQEANELIYIFCYSFDISDSRDNKKDTSIKNAR